MGSCDVTASTLPASPWVTMPLRSMTTAQCMCAHALPCKCNPLATQSGTCLPQMPCSCLQTIGWLRRMLGMLGYGSANAYQNDHWGLKWHWWCKRCQTQNSPSMCKCHWSNALVSNEQCATTFCCVASLSACCQHLDATLANMPFWGYFFSNARRKWPSTLTYTVSMAMFHVSMLVIGIHEVHGV